MEISFSFHGSFFLSSASAATFLHFVAKLEFLKDMEKRKLSVCEWGKKDNKKLQKEMRNFTLKCLRYLNLLFSALWVTQHCAVLNGTSFKTFKNNNKTKNNPTRLTKCIHQNDGNETTRMKPFLAISFYLYPTGLQRVVGRANIDRVDVLEVFELPDVELGLIEV